MPSYGYGKGGFGSWTKTGRNIQLGRSLGESLARQSSKSSSSNSSSEGDSYCGTFICILLVLIMIDTITKVKNIQLQ
jgi:hypothetical protein